VEKLFSTTELARMWNVSESTVKRWADSGELRCVRTVGGHRRFQLEEVSRFQKAHGFDAVGILCDLGPEAEPVDPLDHALERLDYTALSDLYFQHAVEGRCDGVMRTLRRAHLRGIPAIELFERVVAPGLRRVGDLWRRGELTVADEHLATRTTVDALTRLEADLTHVPRESRTAVIGCTEGELHEVGSRCAALLLELDGWRVISLGTNTPYFSFGDMLARHKPRLICIASTIMVDIERQVRDYARFREAAAEADTRVVLGGEGFRDPDVLARFPHDCYASTFRDLLRYASAV
jgi:excisionase family DNA binding protein